LASLFAAIPGVAGRGRLSEGCQGVRDRVAGLPVTVGPGVREAFRECGIFQRSSGDRENLASALRLQILSSRLSRDGPPILLENLSKPFFESVHRTGEAGRPTRNACLPGPPVTRTHRRRGSRISPVLVLAENLILGPPLAKHVEDIPAVPQSTAAGLTGALVRDHWNALQNPPSQSCSITATFNILPRADRSVTVFTTPLRLVIGPIP